MTWQDQFDDLAGLGWWSGRIRLMMWQQNAAPLDILMNWSAVSSDWHTVWWRRRNSPTLPWNLCPIHVARPDATRLSRRVGRRELSRQRAASVWTLSSSQHSADANVGGVSRWQHLRPSTSRAGDKSFRLKYGTLILEISEFLSNTMYDKPRMTSWTGRDQFIRFDTTPACDGQPDSRL